jgi:GNAT superfamily N-acetyltransferase
MNKIDSAVVRNGPQIDNLTAIATLRRASIGAESSDDATPHIEREGYTVADMNQNNDAYRNHDIDHDYEPHPDTERQRRDMIGEMMSGSSLVMVVASPDNPDIDDFDCGQDWWATEITEDLKRREWTKRKDNTLHLFYSGKALVGVAHVGFWKRPYPHWDSPNKANYLVLFDFAVDVRFQGKKDTSGGHSYTRAILDYVFSKAAARKGCVGVSLLVRQKNSHAHDFYTTYGFVDEKLIAREKDKSLIEMRRPIMSP